MTPLRRVLALTSAATLAVVSACTPTDTTATAFTQELIDSLSDRELDPELLDSPEAAKTFAEQIAPLADFPFTVTPGEVEYELTNAVLPLTWEWQIEGETWAYETEVDLVYEESQWWATWQPEALHPDLHAGALLGVDRTVPERAQIVDLEGNLIVTLRPVQKYGFDKPQVDPDDWESAARRVADALDVNPDWFASRVLANGPQAFVEARTLRPESAEASVPADFLDLPGAYVVSDEAFIAPTESFAREVLGTSGEATAEIIENSGGQISAGDVVGLSGLQRQYDEQLRGVGAIEVFTVDAATCEDPSECAIEDRRVLTSIDAGGPKDLVLTLDIDMQIAAEKALSGVPEVDGDVPGASLVAIEPSTGNVLAIAGGAGNHGINHAALGQYAPGSTFKVVTALALIRSGLSPDDLVPCPEATTVGGWEFENNEAYPPQSLGEIPFIEAFAHSCNTFLIELRDRISESDLIDAASALGLGSELTPTDLGYPSFLGSVDPGSDPTQFAAALIGQGSTLVSPLAMATVAASVQAGETLSPILVDSLRPSSSPAQPLTEEEADALRTLMGAVTETGTGQILRDVPGDPVLAKTGTAEHGSEWDEPHAWVIAAQDDVAVAVLVEAGLSGALTAGPIIKEFLTAVANLKK